MVSTQPMKTWKDFFNQRIRWASKARKYQDKRILPVLALVYLFNLLFKHLFTLLLSNITLKLKELLNGALYSNLFMDEDVEIPDYKSVKIYYLKNQYPSNSNIYNYNIFFLS